MAPRIAPLSRPIVRRVGRLVIRITDRGVELRGYRKQTGARFVSWAQVAALSQSDEPILLECEERVGGERLQAMQAVPGSRPKTGENER